METSFRWFIIVSVVEMCKGKMESIDWSAKFNVVQCTSYMDVTCLNVDVISDIIPNNRIHVYYTPDVAQKDLENPKWQNIENRAYTLRKYWIRLVTELKSLSEMFSK